MEYFQTVAHQTVSRNDIFVEMMLILSFSPYSAERIASLRGLLPQSYASSDMALKLWKQLNEHRDNGTYEMTFGVTGGLFRTLPVRVY